MKKTLKFILSFMIIITTIFSLSSYFVKAENNQEAAPENTTVVIHKILMSKSDFAKFDHDRANEQKKYNGNQLDSLGEYFGESAKEIAGVAFNVYKKEESQVANSKLGSDWNVSGLDANTYYTKVGEDYLTSDSGAEVTLPKGIYVFVENKEKSTYKGSEQQLLAESKAVPFTLELPQGKYDGSGYFDTVTKLHVYPKNTEDKPEVDKKFADTEDMEKNVTVGQEIPYKVTTKIPKGSDYKTVSWTDTMVTGLDFVKQSIGITDDSNLGLVANVDYTVTESIRGFNLKFTTSGLEKLSQKSKEKDVNFVITYRAVLNEGSVVDTSIPNKVKFNYGNNPGFDFNEVPKPTTPKDGSITVTKTWSDGQAPAGVEAVFDIYEEETGLDVGDLTLNAANNYTATLSDLKQGVNYIAVERSLSGYRAEYLEITEAGKIVVKNHKDPNPTPIEPTPPNVETYGKKFVKVDKNQRTKKLSGAEFVIKNVEGKFLVLKDTQQQSADKATYDQKEAEYQEAIKNNSQDKDVKKQARDEAYNTLNIVWDWSTNESDAFKITSGEEGEFEIKGLAAGTYKLKEVKAPEGYALLKEDIEFVAGKGTYTQGTRQEIENKNITIPQTGGMGTVIFTITGLLVMIGSVVAIKRRKEQ